MKTSNHYDTLGVARNAPAEVIRGAYKALAQIYHPDKNFGNPDATNLMQAINQAYDVLSDPQKKAEYDAALSYEESRLVVQAGSGQRQGYNPSQGGPNPTYPYPQQQSKKGSSALFLLTLLVSAVSFIFFNYLDTPVKRPQVSAPPVVAQPPITARPAPQPQTKTITPQELAACVFKSAKTYDVPPAALLSLLSEEGGAVGQKSRVSGNTYDLGLLQINSSWVPQLAQDWGVTEDVALRMVRDDACVNINAGAWILHTALQKNADMPRAITAYHAAAHHVDERATDAEYVQGVMKLMDLYKGVHSAEDLK